MNTSVTAATPKAYRKLALSRRSRERQLVTPEGLALPLTLASRGSRVGAMLLDLIFLYFGSTLVLIALVMTGINLFGDDDGGPVLEAVEVLFIMFMFLSHYGYFLLFELGPRGATPGKRLLGIRVAARDGGRLTAEAVLARNLLRDIELFLPIQYLLYLAFAGVNTDGVMGWATAAWVLIFLLFPVFNRDRLRAGDLVSGTWVVESPRLKLAEAMSTAPSHAADYRFGEAELSVYGEHELQVLESVLRQNNPEAMREVMFAICRKIGWSAGTGHEREFLEAFYNALRGHLESGMRFGKRKADKFS